MRFRFHEILLSRVLTTENGKTSKKLTAQKPHPELFLRQLRP